MSRVNQYVTQMVKGLDLYIKNKQTILQLENTAYCAQQGCLCSVPWVICTVVCDGLASKISNLKNNPYT